MLVVVYDSIIVGFVLVVFKVMLVFSKDIIGIISLFIVRVVIYVGDRVFYVGIKKVYV